MRKSFLMVVVCITMMLMSCQPDQTNPVDIQHCKVVTGYYYGGSGGINDSVAFTYTGNKLTRAEGNDEYVLFFYTGDNIISRRFYEKPGDLFEGVDSVEYDGSNKITRFTSWEYPSSFNFDSVRAVYNFSYSGNQINNITETDIYMDGTTDVTHYAFSVNGSGNYDKILIADQDNIIYDSIMYTYDANPNYFKLAHPHFFLFEPFFQLHVGLVPHLPYFYSQNNVIKYTIYSNVDYNIVYGLDSLHNVTSLDMGGFEYMKYKYSCP